MNQETEEVVGKNGNKN